MRKLEIKTRHKSLKRHGNLFYKIVSLDNLRLAHKNARRGKRKYTDVKYVDKNLQKCLLDLQTSLINKTYKTGAYTRSVRLDRGKRRVILKLGYYPDRILHHAVMQILEPIWKKTLIPQTYQSIKGRGTSACMHDVHKCIKQHSDKDLWILKLDIAKYYPSVNNKILKKIIRKKIKCAHTLWLLDSIIDSHVGLPIGNYISQYFGNLYLSYFDRWVKSNASVLGYFRYCDDVVVLLPSKAHCVALQKTILLYLRKQLKLSVNNKVQYFLLQQRPLDFVGYIFYTDGTIKLRKRIKQGCIRSIRLSMEKSMPSYWGWVLSIDATCLWSFYSRLYPYDTDYKKKNDNKAPGNCLCTRTK